MKKFLVKIFLFFLPVIVLCYPIDLLISNFFSKCHSISFAADEFSVWNDIYKKKIDSDIAIYGSSRAWVHFNSKMITDSLGYDAYNFGIDGHNFWLQYLRHKEYIANNNPPKVIILSVDYATLQKREDLYNYDQFLPYMLWNDNIMEYTSSYAGFKNQDFKIPLLRYMGKVNFFRKGITLALNDCNDLQKREKGFVGMERKWEDDLSKAKRKNKNYKILLDEGTIELFEKFLRECNNEEDITVLMVYSPIYFEGLEFIENHSEALEVFKSFAATYKLDFLDYSRDEICYDKTYFYNSNHLNKDGANLFTKKLIEDIKNTNALQRLKRQ